MSNFDSNNKEVSLIGSDIQSPLETICDAKEETELKTAAEMLQDFMKGFDDLVAVKRKEGVISEPDPTTWLGWAEKYAKLPSVQRLDKSLDYFPQLLGKLKCDCMNGKKGWIMFGRPGCGKTHRATIISNTIGIRMMSARSMVLKFCSSKPNSEEYIRSLAGLGTVHICGRSPNLDLIIDDLGTELPKATLFGTPYVPMTEMLAMRCDEWPRVRTYITTNLTPKDLEAHVGDRLWSRFNEQMTFLQFKDIDHRVTNNNSSAASVNNQADITRNQGTITPDEGQVQQEDPHR